jgi:hypothetical protein
MKLYLATNEYQHPFPETADLTVEGAKAKAVAIFGTDCIAKRGVCIALLECEPVWVVGFRAKREGTMSETTDLQAIVIESHERKLRILELDKEITALKTAAAIGPRGAAVNINRDPMTNLVTVNLSAHVDLNPSDLEGPGAREAVRRAMEKLTESCFSQVIEGLSANRRPRRPS